MAEDFMPAGVREERQGPAWRALELLRQLQKVADEVYGTAEVRRVMFDDTCHEYFQQDAEDAHDVASRLLEESSFPDVMKGLIIASAYCIDAWKADQQGRTVEAWRELVVGAQLAGYLSAVVEDTTAAQAVAQAAADWSPQEPKRDDGLQRALYETLKRFHDAGRPRPTAKQILNEWLTDKPPQVLRVLVDEVAYIDSSTSDEAVCDAENLRQRIKRMTQTGR